MGSLVTRLEYRIALPVGRGDPCHLALRPFNIDVVKLVRFYRFREPHRDRSRTATKIENAKTGPLGPRCKIIEYDFEKH